MYMTWTNQAKTKLIKLCSEGYTDAEIGRFYSPVLTYTQIEKARKRYNITKAILTNKKEIIKTSAKFHAIIEGLKDSIKRATPYKVIKNKKSKGDTLMIQFTDWHIGKEIKNEAGEIVFNEEIARLRINVLVNQCLNLLDNHISKGVPIKDVVIMFTGDILDGMGIFASQESQSEMAPPFQVILACEVIQEFVLALVQRKLRVKMYGVKGNHGEIRENGKSKDPNANWDLMLYLILEFWLKTMLKNPLVTIEYSETDFMNFVVNGWKYHIRHIGPKQTETPSGKAKILGWAKTHGFDAIAYGHFHHWAVGDRSKVTVFRGGSLTGLDDLSEKMAEESSPAQLLWGCNEKRVMSFVYAVDLGGKK